MNYTREPIIETIITPKDGFKLIIRNSKGGSQEEYSVDAVEVVSFGQSMFYRSLEKPKSFLLPVGDYEIVEAKETRVVLKNAPLERSIKIGGGKPPVKAPKEAEEERPRKRRSSRRRKPQDSDKGYDETSKAEEKSEFSESEKRAESPRKEEGGGPRDEAKVSSSMFKSLFPPPSGLISDTINRESAQKNTEGNLFSEDVMPKPTENHDSEKDETLGDDEPKVEDQTPSLPGFDEKSEADPVEYGKSPKYHQAPGAEDKQSEEDTSGQKITEETLAPKMTQEQLDPETNLV